MMATRRWTMKPPESVRKTTSPLGIGVTSSLMMLGARMKPRTAPRSTARMLMAMRRRSSERWSTSGMVAGSVLGSPAPTSPGAA